MVFAHANVPGVFFAQMQPQRVRPHRDAKPDVAIAQEHSFEKIRCGQIPNHGVALGDLESVQIGAVRIGPHLGRQNAGRRRRCRGLQESSAIGFHRAPRNLLTS